MGKNLLKFLPWIFAGTVAWSAGFAYNNFYGGLIGRLRSMYFNKMVLASDLKGQRRLLIVGGSGVHYTLNAKLMEQELGFPVFNLGLDGNLGLNVILPSALEQVRPGDTVLLIPEYLMLLDEDGIGERSVSFGVATGQPVPKGISPKQWAEDFWLSGIPGLRPLVKTSVDLIEKGEIDDYYADPITERGDPTKTWQRKSKWWPMKIERPISQHAVKRISQFRKEVEAKGATLILSLPVFYASTDRKTIASVKETADKLTEIAPLLYNPETLNLKTDSRLFADTHYHLQPEARMVRSQELVHELDPWLAPFQSNHYNRKTDG